MPGLTRIMSGRSLDLTFTRLSQAAAASSDRRVVAQAMPPGLWQVSHWSLKMGSTLAVKKARSRQPTGLGSVAQESTGVQPGREGLAAQVSMTQPGSEGLAAQVSMTQP